jgi:hypothetical protein
MDFSKHEQMQKHIHIVSAIERGASFGGDIWQVGAEQKRTVFHFIQLEFDSFHEKIILKSTSLSQVEQGYPIFIRLHYRNIVFRLEREQFQVIGNKLICSIPKEVRALAMRPTDRYVLPFDLDMSISIQRFAHSIKEMTPGLEVRLIDVSESGIGIMISGSNKDFLRPCDHFWIKEIDHKTLDRDIFGTVLYVTPKKQDVRVGLSLSVPLNWNVFSGLKNKCRIILSA